MQQILEYANDLQPTLISIRRHLHMHPELSFQEIETGKYIADKLTELNVEFTNGWAGHGLVAKLKSKEEGPTIYLRADIDALPIHESMDREYRSKVDNKMHACGHDVHTTCLLGAIMILLECKDVWKGTIYCIFQPGEEKLPGGASIMIEEGLFQKPLPKVIIGQHVHPPLEVGKVGYHPGPYMASADELYLTIKGKGGHAALMDNCINPILIASEVILEYNKLYDKYKENGEQVVLNFGKAWTDGGATNVIPDQMFFEGTFRAMDEKIRNEVHEKMTEIANQMSEKTGAYINLEIKRGYPVLINNPEKTNQAKSYSEQILTPSQVVDLPQRMTSEDFAFFSHIVPAVFYRLGTGNKQKGIVHPVHTSSFDVDEDCLKIGASNLAFLAIQFLNNES